MQKKLTISVDEFIYDELCRVVGRGNISKFIENLVRPRLQESELDAAYREMGTDCVREQEALEWANGVMGDSSNEAR